MKRQNSNRSSRYVYIFIFTLIHSVLLLILCIHRSSSMKDIFKFIILSFCLSPTLGVWFPCRSRPKTTRHSLAELYLPQLHHRKLSSTHSWNHWRGWESHRETRREGCPHLTYWQGHRAATWVLRDRKGETLWPLQTFSRLCASTQRFLLGL